MSTQIKVEYLIRPGSRIPIKIARQIIDVDQIIAVAPIHAQAQSMAPVAYYTNGQAAAVMPPAGPSSVQAQTVVSSGPAGNAPRGPAQSKANGGFPNAPASAPSKPRGGQTQQQSGALQGSKQQPNSNNANYHKNTGSATSGKSLLQRMNIGLAERISGAPTPKGNPPTEPASAKKLKKHGVAGPGPARPNAR